jgi:hypothetical protein
MGGENLPELVRKQAEIIRKQAETITKQAGTIARLEARIIELEAAIALLKKNSHNSSKPPSSDIVKPKTAVENEKLAARAAMQSMSVNPSLRNRLIKQSK